MPEPIRHVFSTGIVRIGAPGLTPLGSDDVVGEVQNISFDGTFQKKEMRTAASISNFAVDVAHYDGNCGMKMEVGDFKASLLPILLGAAKTAGSPTGYDSYAITGTSKPAFFRLEFEGIDTNGKAMRIILPRAKAPGLSTSFKRDDFAMPSFEPTGYPVDFADPSSAVCLIQMAQ